MRASTLLIVAALAGCAPGKSIVTVTVDASAPVGPIDHLTVTPSDASGHTDTVNVPVGATIPPAFTFSLRFDASVKTTIHVAVAAIDPNGLTIGSAAGDVDVKPSSTLRLPLTLMAPTGTTLVFATQPSNAAIATSIKPSVQVAVQDDNGHVVDGNFDVSVALGSTPAGATLGGTRTQSTVNGVATFADLTVDTLGTGYTLVATAQNLASATSMPFDVTPPVWVAATSGIFGGTVNWIAFDPASGARAYAGTTSGAFKTTDGGATWTSINAGLSSRSINVIAVDPFNPMRVLAGTTFGMFVSNDAGGSWSQANFGFDPTMESPRRIFFEPATANTIWMATEKPNVYVSAGATISWDSRSNAAWPGLPSARATGLGVDAAGNVYVATFNNVGGLWKLTKGSTAWAQIGAPIPSNYIDSMVVDRASATTVIWVGNDATSATGIFKGDGATFAASSNGLPLNFVEGIGVAQSNPLTVYVSGSDTAGDPFVYKTTNGGGAWAPAATGLPTTSDYRPNQTTIAVDPTDPAHVLFPSPSGVFRTTTGGGSWSASNSGLTGWQILSLATVPGATSGVVVAGTNGGGIFRTGDGGVSWTTETIGDKFVRVLISANGKLYAGTQSLLATSPDGVTWTTVPSSGTTNALAAAPSNNMVMYSAAGTTVTVSNDGGTTFGSTSALAGAMPPTGIAVDPTNPMIVYVATLGTGVYRSANGGANWGATNSGLANTSLHAIAVSPSNAMVVLAGSDGGIFRSTDGGSSWTLAGGTAGVSVTSFALHPTKANVAFASSTSGILQSIDGGVTWKPYNAGLGDTLSNIVTIDVHDANVLWAGTSSAGVYVARP